ncbi:MAG: putative glycoside hydrolase [candidate division WOR-3 bacterium]
MISLHQKNRFLFFIIFLLPFLISSEKIQGIYVSRYVASSNRFYNLLEKLKENSFNAVVIDMKYDYGDVAVKLDSTYSLIGSYQKINHLKEKIDTLKKLGIKPIARIVCFKDNILGKYDNYKYAVKYSDGSIYYDLSKAIWVSPYSNFVQNYIIDIAKECAKIGFSEIQFDYIRFPTDGIKGTLVFPERNSLNGFETIINFLNKAYNELKPYGVDVSCDVYGYTVWFDSLNLVNQHLDGMAVYADAIYPMVYPSHFSDSLYRKLGKEERTYQIIYQSGVKSKKRIEKFNTKTILYLQDFTWKSSLMGNDYVNNQIKAAIDSDVEGFILWNPSSKYSYFELPEKINFSNYKKDKR